MISEKQKEKLLKRYWCLYTDWEATDDFQMKKVENQAAKGLTRCLIEEACQQIRKNNQKKNEKGN